MSWSAPSPDGNQHRENGKGDKPDAQRQMDLSRPDGLEQKTTNNGPEYTANERANQEYAEHFEEPHGSVLCTKDDLGVVTVVIRPLHQKLPIWSQLVKSRCYAN